jgi:hypothetical protein
VEPEFDADFYRKTYPDVLEAGWNPLQHFLLHGWREDRDPNPRFSTRGYLDQNPDVAELGVNPFVWFLTRPKGEPELGFRHEIIVSTAPYETRIAPARKPVPLARKSALTRALAGGRRGLPGLHITFSHDDYTANLGGVQLGLQREAAAIAARGRDHLHIFPARAWQMVRTAADPGQLGVVWNGAPVGVFEATTIVEALRKAATAPPDGRSFAIHSLLGHTADETADIVEAAGLKDGFFWLHDFASLCAGFHLLRNDVQDCAAPPPESAACEICLYSPNRARHVSAHQRLLRRLRLTVVAPSQATLDLWRRAWTHPEPVATLVHPHARLVASRPAPPPRNGRPFRLGYGGFPVDHKGWSVFRSLAASFIDDPRYEFVHLGAREAPEWRLPFHEVRAGPHNPLAMLDALNAEQPDALLIWPLCRETFSFIAYEAVAAGCAVITSPDSGNVAAFVGDGDHGVVLPDEAALHAAFASGEILSLGRAARRPMTYDIAFSALTADLIREPEPA